MIDATGKWGFVCEEAVEGRRFLWKGEENAVFEWLAVMAQVQFDISGEGFATDRCPLIAGRCPLRYTTPE